MATASVERERKRVRSRARMSAVKPANDAALVATKPKRSEPDRKPGLRWMLGKGKITRAMCEAGERYGLAVRVASAGDAASIRSCLASLESGGGGGGGSVFRIRRPEELEAAEWVAEAKRQEAHVRLEFFEDIDLMGVLDSLCVKQLSPREMLQGLDGSYPPAAQLQRGAEKLEAVAYTVLKLLVGHWREYDALSQPRGCDVHCAA